MRVQKSKPRRKSKQDWYRELSPFLINTAMAPKKGMQKSLPCLIVSLRHCIPPIGKQGKEMLGAKKGVAFLHGNGTHSRVSFYFRPFFVRVIYSS